MLALAGNESLPDVVEIAFCCIPFRPAAKKRRVNLDLAGRRIWKPMRHG